MGYTLPTFEEGELVALLKAARTTTQDEVDERAAIKAHSDATPEEHMDYTHHVEYGAARH